MCAAAIMQPLNDPARRPMRFDLKVPFAEKDTAKKLGARWDAASKTWYVLGQDNMTQFDKWLPTPHDATGAVSATRARAPTNTKSSGKVYVGSHYVEHPRVCDCLPWEACNRCQALGFPSLADSPLKS